MLTIQKPRPASAFTLIELLVTIAIVALLAAVLVRALARAKAKAKAISCMNGQRQLTLAWRMYTDDSRGRLPYATENFYNSATRSATWVTGQMDRDSHNRSNWDLKQDILTSPLGSYGANVPALWKCPSDQSSITVSGRDLPRVRSRAMNLYLGGYGGLRSAGMNNCRVYLKDSDMIAPTPALLMVLVETREDSIDWGNFGVNMTGYSPGDESQYAFWDLPANYHANSSSFTFADGHAELKRWLDPETTPALVLNGSIRDQFGSPGNPDIAWMQERATRPVDPTQPSGGKVPLCGGGMVDSNK
jgi:prepilin-type N-terminal cleavage/methylation domain-containing protein/prepilin-type processing-associated H-X9-DG protein